MKLFKYLEAGLDFPPKPEQGYMRCSTCKKESPLSDFTRRASLSQTKHWLKNPNAKKCLVYTGKVCNACYSKQKEQARANLTPEVLRKRLVNQGLHPLKIAARVDALRLKGAMERTRKTASTKLKNTMPELKAIYADIDLILNRLKNKLLHLRRCREGQSDGAIFCGQCIVMLETVKDSLRDRAKRGAKLPEDWHEVIDPRFRKTLPELFVQVSKEHKQRFAPFLVHVREVEAEK